MQNHVIQCFGVIMECNQTLLTSEILIQLAKCLHKPNTEAFVELLDLWFGECGTVDFGDALDQVREYDSQRVRDFFYRWGI